MVKARTLRQFKVLQKHLFEKGNEDMPLLLLGDSESQDLNNSTNNAECVIDEKIEVTNESIDNKNGDDCIDNNDPVNSDNNDDVVNNNDNNDNNNNANNNNDNNDDNINDNNINDCNNNEEEEDHDVFLYIIYSGCEHYYKVGFNSMSLGAFLSRYHTYYGEFKFLKFSLMGGMDVSTARLMGQSIETQFKNKHVEDTAFFKHELFDRKRDDVEMLGVYKKSMQIIMKKTLSENVSWFYFLFAYLHQQLCCRALI